MSAKSETSSVISPSTRIVGNVSGSGSLRVAGRIEGSIEVSGAVELLEGAQVTGDVHARDATIGGELQGDVECSGPIHLGANAAFEGTLRGSQVAIEPGARVRAKLDTAFELNLEI